MVALARICRTVTAAHVRQLTSVADVTRRTAATVPTTDARTVVHVMALGPAAVHLATQVVTV